MILNFGSFTRRGLLVDLERPAAIWEDGDHISDRAGRAGGGVRPERRQYKTKTTNLLVVRE